MFAFVLINVSCTFLFLQKTVAGRYLAALCHYECQEFEESLEKLDNGEMGPQNPFSTHANKSLFSNDHTITHDDEEEEDENGLPVKGVSWKFS